MATKVAGDMYYELDGQLAEIKRQLRQQKGYPFDPVALQQMLQAVIEGNLSFQSLKDKLQSNLFRAPYTESVVQVNLNAPMTSPQSYDHPFIRHPPEGWVTVENREGTLYVDRKKCTLHKVGALSSGSKILSGYEIDKVASSLDIVHPNVIDVLLDRTSLIPYSWRPEEDGEVKLIHFWKKQRSGTGECVRFLGWFNNIGWSSGFWGLSGNFGNSTDILVYEN